MGDWGNTRYSTLSQINTQTVNQLGAAWMSPRLTPPANSRSMSVVKDGMMFFTAPPSIYKINAKTGETVWKFETGGVAGPRRAGRAAMGTPNREGVVVAEGLVFAGLSDSRVIAVREATGELVWNQYVGDKARDKGQVISAAPVYAGGIVSVGLSADNGWRGQIVGLDAQDRARGLALVRRAGARGAGQRVVAEDGAMEIRRRGDVARRRGRSGRRSRLLRDRQRRAATVGRVPRRRQPLPLFDRRAGHEDRQAQVALPDDSSRHLGSGHVDFPGAVRDAGGRPAAKGDRRDPPRRLPLHPRPGNRQAAAEDRGSRGAAGRLPENREQAAVPGQGSRARCTTATGGGSSASPAASRSAATTRRCRPRSRTCSSRTTACVSRRCPTARRRATSTRWASGPSGWLRRAEDPYFFSTSFSSRVPGINDADDGGDGGDRQPDGQDCVEEGVQARRGTARRDDGHGRGPGVPDHARRQFQRLRRQDRERPVAVPDRIGGRRTGGQLRDRRRTVHRGDHQRERLGVQARWHAEAGRRRRLPRARPKRSSARSPTPDRSRPLR